MLPSAELKGVYDKVAWLWNTRDFTEDARDRAAERVEIRFGMTTYPNLLLVDPASEQVLAECAREVAPFLEAVRAAASRVKKGKAASGADTEAIAGELEEATAAKKAHPKAAALVGEADPVVRFRALQNLAATDPAQVAKRAGELLKVPNDAFRFAVLDVLTQAKDAAASPSVLALLKGADDAKTGSHNPNVLRCHAAAALGAMGDAGAIEALGPYATTGDYRNGLTRTAIDAIASIGERCGEKGRRPAAEALLAAFPKGEAVPANEVAMRTQLATAVQSALERVLGKGPEFPSDWTPATRDKLVAGWKARLGKGR